MCIFVFTKVRHFFLSKHIHPVSLRNILILSSPLRLGLAISLSHSAFPTEVLQAYLFFRMRATCPTHVFHLDLSSLLLTFAF